MDEDPGAPGLTVDTAGGVLANDADPEGAPLTAAVESPPTHGTLSLATDGSFVYTPDADFFGTDTFEYRASDGVGESAATVVTITVNRVIDDAPVAVDDAYSTEQGLALMVNNPASGYVQAVLADSPVGYWRLGEPAGPIAVDETGDHDGVYSGTIEFGRPGALAGENDTSVGLDGTGGVATVAHHPALTPALLTVEVWIRPDPTAGIYDAVLTKSSDTNWVDGYGLYYSGAGEITFYVNNYSSSSVSAPIAFDQWQHVVGTYDGNDLRLYLDGALVSSRQLGAPIAHVTANLLLLQGEGSTSWAWTGELDEIAVYGTVLSAQRVAAHYMAGVGSSGPGGLGVLANDRDADGDSLTAELVSGPTHGELSLNGDGTFTYTPDPQFLGFDSFTYLANDGTANSSVATVTIEVVDVNSIPQAQNDTYSIDEDGTLSIDVLAGVLANDTDVELTPLTATVAGQPPNGTLALAADGSFVYTPNANFFGTDTFTYRAGDGENNSPPALVTIAVRSINDVPLAADDAYEVNEDTQLVVMGGPAMDVTLVPFGGTWKYLDDGSDQGTAWRGPSFDDSLWSSGLAQLGYGDGDEATVVDCDPNPGDGCQDFSNDNFITTYFRTTFTIDDASRLVGDLRGNFHRDDGIAVYINGIEVARDNLPSGATSGTPANQFAFDDGQNVIPFTAPIDLIESGVNYIAVEIHQSDGNSSDISFDLELIAQAQPIVGVLTNDTDADGETLSAELVAGPQNGTLTLQPDGTFTYQPNQDFVGTDQFSYRAGDGTAFSAPATVTITVHEANLLPVAANDAFTTAEDVPLVVDLPLGLLPNDTDGDGDALSTRIVAPPTHGTLDWFANGTFKYVPAANYHGSDSFTYVANDGRADSNTATVTITISAVNDAPAAQEDVYAIAAGETLTTGTPPITIGPNLFVWSTADGGNGHVYEYVSEQVTWSAAKTAAEARSIAGAQGHLAVITGSLEMNVLASRLPRDEVWLGGFQNPNSPSYSEPGGGWEWVNGEPFTFAPWRSGEPSNSFGGEDAIEAVPQGGEEQSYVWNDSNMNQTTHGFWVEYPTAFDSLPLTQMFPRGSVWSYRDDITNTSPYPSNVEGDDWTENDYDDSGWPSGQAILGYGGIDAGPIFTAINFGPDGNDKYRTALFRRTFQVADAQRVEWLAINLLADDGAAIYLNGVEVLRFNLPGTLGDGALRSDTLTVRTGIENRYSTLLFNPAAFPGALFNGTNTIAVEVHQAQPDSSDLGFDMALAALLGTGSVSDTPGVSANDADADGNPLSASVVDGPFHGTLDFDEDGSFTYTPDAGFTGVEQFSYVARDATSASAPTRVTINVGGVNLPPAAAADRYRMTRGQAFSVSAAGGVLANDGDPNGDPLLAQIVAMPANGSLTLNADGGFTYMPAAGFTGIDSFQYTASDGMSQTAPVSVVLNVRPTADPINSIPQAMMDRYHTPFNPAPPGFTVSPVDGVLSNDSDTEEQPLVATLVAPPRHGTLDFAADGGFLYRPLVGFHGTDSFTYRADDGNTSTPPTLVVIEVLLGGPARSEPLLAGDANHDGVVNAADVTFVLRHSFSRLGMSAYDPAADIDGDGRVNARDAVILRNQLASQPSAGAIVRTSLVPTAVDSVLAASDSRHRLRARRGDPNTANVISADVAKSITSASTRVLGAAIRSRRASF